MAKIKSTPAKAASPTINLALVQLRCERAAAEIDRVRRLLQVGAGAIAAAEDTCQPFELPEDAITEVLELADKRLGTVAASLDCVRIKAEPTEEERKEVASHEKIMRDMELGHAERRP